MKKIAVLEACEECPFFVNNINDENNCLCQKIYLKGTAENLWKVCPLPDDISLCRSRPRPKGYIQYG